MVKGITMQHPQTCVDNAYGPQASVYGSSAVFPLARAYANFSCRAFFRTGVMEPWESEMEREFNEDLIAELASLNTLAMAALKAIAASQVDPEGYLARILESGLSAMEKTVYYSIPAERQRAVIEKAQARFTDAVTSIKI
jgi:hypothetical protein